MVRYNEDEAVVKRIKKSLAGNMGYCPCKVEHKLENKCVCEEFLERVRRGEYGACFCGLFIYEEDDDKDED